MYAMATKRDMTQLMIEGLVRQAKEASPEAFKKRLKAMISTRMRADMVDTPIGRIAARPYSQGGVSSQQYAAAEAYRGLRIVALGRLEPETMDYWKLIKEYGDTDRNRDDQRPEMTERDRRVLSLRYARWRQRLRRDESAFLVVDRIVIHQRAPRWIERHELSFADGVELLALRRGLDRLVDIMEETRR